MSTARYDSGAAKVGTQSSTAVFGGEPGSGDTAATEEWTGAGTPVTKTVTAT